MVATHKQVEDQLPNACALQVVKQQSSGGSEALPESDRQSLQFGCVGR